MGAIVAEINRKLRNSLPTEVFFAACFLDFKAGGASVFAWNGGVPDALIFRPGVGIRARIPSHSIPLGVVDNLQCQPVRLEVSPEDRIYMYSDGVIEASNPDGMMFGPEGLERLFRADTDADKVFDTILDGVGAWRKGGEQADDTTLVEILCKRPTDWHVPEPTGDVNDSQPMIWQSSLELSGDTLKMVDPIPVLMHVVTELQGLDGYREPLYTVLAELFNNALEHGLLKLESSLKRNVEGFSEYYALRQQRLSELTEGSIRFDFKHDPQGSDGGRLSIKVTDTGPGFDFEGTLSGLANNLSHSGRGIALVKTICDKVSYYGNGNSVVAEFVWGAAADSEA